MDYDSDENENGNGNSGNVETAERGGLSSCGYWYQVSDNARAAVASAVLEDYGITITTDKMNVIDSGKIRNLNIVELMCCQCGSWFHESCISYQLGKLVPFMLNYTFTCKNCSSTAVESFRKNQAQLRDMVITAIGNLQHEAQKENGSHSTLFSLTRDIIPFLEQHWEALTTASRRSTQTWHTTLQKILMKEADTTFRVEETNSRGEITPYHPYFGLSCNDLTLIRPTVDIASLIWKSSAQVGGKGRGAKRKVPDSFSGSKKARGDMPAPKLHGYPVDHPYNKDGYRYILAEPDPHAPFRQEFDESSDWAGKPIPGWLYRVVSPSALLLALHDRAPQLKPSDDRLAVTGEKGYCLIRATHGVHQGTWYWECTIKDQPDGSHTRLGWGQQYANLQAPLGYDKFGYSWRSRKGTIFHESNGIHYSEGYEEGDILGILVHLPEENNTTDKLPPTYKDKPLVKFRSHLYYEDKDDIPIALKKLKPLFGSRIIFFKNGVEQGVAFKDIYSGVYYPSLSLYKSITVAVNFGPSFKYPPQNYDYKAMDNRCNEMMVEQTLADVTYLVENEGKLRLDLI